MTRSSTWPSAERISTGVARPFSRSSATSEKSVALGQHAIHHQHVEIAVERERQARLVFAVAGDLGHVAGFAQRLLQVIGGFAIVLDNKQAHGESATSNSMAGVSRISCLQAML